MKGVQGVFMQAISIVALDEGHQGQQHTDHGDAAEEALIAHNLEGLYVQICHEVVLKGDLSGLHTLQTDTFVLTCMISHEEQGFKQMHVHKRIGQVPQT